MTPPRAKQLHIDCFAGIAGDMFLGAMLDLGVPEPVVRDGLAALPVSTFELRVDRATRMGIVARDVKVVVPSPQGDHWGDHAGHSHRSWRSIRGMLESSTLDDNVKRRAVRIFERVARAEGRLHGKPPDEVAFHEVGAVDSIVDIVGAAVALEYLAPARVTSRPVPLGRGKTRCAHGTLPVPSPAAVAILAEAEAAVEDGDAELELCTPTGAAIIADTVSGFGGIPAARIIAAGYGAGDAQLEDRPNLLRLLLFEPAPARELDREAVVLEANIDNMPPEWCGYLMERLFAAGARDVWYTPIQMKKGRPALTVSTLCAGSDREAVGAVLLAESTTIGLRYHHVGRRVLAREHVEVETPYGGIRVKVAREGERALNAVPEYEDCRAAARRSGAPLKEVHAAALAAYRNLADLRGER
jgi:uncharacterized protein (TIGR00299 family) protein